MLIGVPVRAFLFVPTVILSGCASWSPGQVAQPTSISLDKALSEVVTAFANAQSLGKEKKVQLGIATCSVTITFNVTASANQDGKLVLDAAIKAPAAVNVGGGLTAEQDVGSASSRGNTVTMVMTSELCLPPNTSGANLFSNIGKATQASENKEGGQKQANVRPASESKGADYLSYPRSMFRGRDDNYLLNHRDQQLGERLRELEEQQNNNEKKR